LFSVFTEEKKDGPEKQKTLSPLSLSSSFFLFFRNRKAVFQEREREREREVWELCELRQTIPEGKTNKL